MIGKTLGHYRITEKLGAGGMGEVYLARDNRLERDVAVKVLPSGALSDEQTRKRFRKEALTLSKLNHPHIATVFDFDTQDGVDFLVMEYVPGETLKEKLSGGPLPEKDVTRLGLQIAEALEAAHEKGVIHRDLKPGNIALTERGDAKVLDFGIAKLLRSKEELAEAATVDTLTKTAGMAGTLPYMSPEQLRGEEVDARSDIYAFGVVLYEMVTGQRPFDEKQYTAMTDAILHQPPPSLGRLKHGLSTRLEETLLKCLEKDPANRYQHADELAVDLRRLATPTVASVSRELPGGSARWITWGLGVGLGAVALLAVLIGLNVGGLRDRLVGSVAPGEITSIAVLPLDNMMGDAEQDYFVEGMHEALITELSKISALTVISRTSTLGYKGTDKSIPEIARELGVDAVIEGSVLQVGDTVRVTTQLIDGRTDRHLWANNFDRELKDILALHSDVARAIAREIKIAVTPEEETRLAATRPVNPEAYEAYLKGRYYWNKRTEEGFNNAIGHFQRATEIDPAYAPAYSGLADSHLMLGRWGIIPTKEANPRAKAAALKAFEIDESLAEAHTSLGLYHQTVGDWPACEKEFKRALELNPNYASANQWYGETLSFLGRHNEAIPWSQRARELDPLSPVINRDLARAFYLARQYDRCIAQAQSTVQLFPEFAPTYWLLGNCYLEKGMPGEATAAFQKAASLSGTPPEKVAALKQAVTQGGISGYYLWRLDNLREQSKRKYVPAAAFAMAYARLNQKAQALAWLEKAYQDRDHILARLKTDPIWDSLRSDPRFQALLHRMNFPEN